jgi:prevent-host-death family protein
MHERENMEVLKVSAAEFQRNIGRYQDLALRQPVAVTRNGRESCVLLSTEEYRRLKRRDREVLRIEDFTEADAEAVRRARPSAESAAFNHELKP